MDSPIQAIHLDGDGTVGFFTEARTQSRGSTLAIRLQSGEWRSPAAGFHASPVARPFLDESTSGAALWQEPSRLRN